MGKQDELFLLIKSMNKNEKGYFHKFSRIHGNAGDGNYQKLFDCIAGMNAYDETVIRAGFKGQKILKHLKVTKYHLKNLIIRSLANYYSNSDPEIEKLQAVVEVSILFKKQLYDSALKMVEKLKIQARAEDNFVQLLQLLQTEWLILIRKGSYQKITADAQNHLQQEQECLLLHENLCQYRNLHGLVFSKLMISGEYDDKSLKITRELLSHPLLKDSERALSFKTKIYRLDMIEICYRGLNDFEKSLETSFQMADLFRANPAQIKIQPYNYYAVINKIARGLSNTCRFSEAIQYSEEAEAIANNRQFKFNSDRIFEILTGVYQLRIFIYAKWGDFDNGLKTDKKILLLADNKPMRPELVVVRAYFAAYCYIGKGQLSKALDNLNKLIHGEFDGVRKDLILCAHWMNVIVHFELGNYALLKRLITVWRNFMVKNKFALVNYDRFLKQFNTIVKAAIAKNDKGLKTGLRALLNETGNYSFWDNDFMRWWIGNKLKQIL